LNGYLTLFHDNGLSFQDWSEKEEREKRMGKEKKRERAS